MRRMISTAKLQQIEDSIENVVKVTPTSLNVSPGVEENVMFLEHDGQKLTGQKKVVLSGYDFQVNVEQSQPKITVKHKQYQNHFVTIKLTGDGGEYFFCLNIIDNYDQPITSTTELQDHLKGSSPYAQVTGYLKMFNGNTFQPMYIDDTLKVHGYLNGVLTPIFLETTPDQYTLGTIRDNVTLL